MQIYEGKYFTIISFFSLPATHLLDCIVRSEKKATETRSKLYKTRAKILRTVNSLFMGTPQWGETLTRRESSVISIFFCIIIICAQFLLYYFY